MRRDAQYSISNNMLGSEFEFDSRQNADLLNSLCVCLCVCVCFEERPCCPSYVEARFEVPCNLWPKPDKL